jgi:hypothetical protein
MADLYDQNGEHLKTFRVDGRTAPHGFVDYMKWEYKGKWAIAYVKLRGQICRIVNLKIGDKYA